MEALKLEWVVFPVLEKKLRLSLLVHDDICATFFPFSTLKFLLNCYFLLRLLTWALPEDWCYLIGAIQRGPSHACGAEVGALHGL